MTRSKEEQRIAVLLAHQREGTIKGAARATGASPGTVRRWVHRHRATGSLKDRPRSGRPAALGGALRAKAADMLLSNDFGTGQAVAAGLHARGATAKPLHRTTVVRGAKAAAKARGRAIRSLRGRPRAQLPPATMAKRIAFAQANLGRDWRRVMFTDRKKFHWRYPGVGVRPSSWHEKGGRGREAPAASHPLAFNVYAGLTPWGLTSAVPVAGTHKLRHSHKNQQGQPAKNVTAGQYKQVLTGTFLPEGQALFGAGGLSSWVLQQDGDPTHKGARAVVEGSKEGRHGRVELLGSWPPSSPDLSPIENVWAYVQRRVDAMPCKTFESFCAAVRNELASVPQKVISRLYASMGPRLKKVIEKGGARTGY